MADATAVQRYFDRTAPEYLRAYTGPQADARSDIFQQRRRRVLELLRQPLGRVLDIGSGPGVFTPALLERGGECWVLDLSLTMVKAGREHVSGSPGQAARVHYGVADVAALPFRDHTFDTVLCVGVLQYLPAPAVALRELARVTRGGGQVIVTFPNAGSPLNRLLGAGVVGARRGRALLQWMGVVIQPDTSQLTFRDDIPNTPLAVPRLEAVARREGLGVDRVMYQSLHFPFAIPGLHGPLRAWDRLANRALDAGWFTTWGREAIMRLTRCA